eukprot:1121598-Rhodomonas_salina.2
MSIRLDQTVQREEVRLRQWVVRAGVPLVLREAACLRCDRPPLVTPQPCRPPVERKRQRKRDRVRNRDGQADRDRDRDRDRKQDSDEDTCCQLSYACTYVKQ